MQKKLKNGMTFANYNELCLFMNWDCTRGNTKKSHIKELESICTWEKNGHKIIINQVFDFAKPIEDKRFDKNKFAEHIAIILLLEHSEFIKVSINKLAKNLALINNLIYNNNQDIFYVKKNFYNIVKNEYTRIIESSIKNLHHQKLLSKIEKTLMYVPLTDADEPDFSLTTVATKHEKEIYFAIKKLNKKKPIDDDWGEKSFFDEEEKKYAKKRLYNDNNIKLFYFVYCFKMIADIPTIRQFTDIYANKYNLPLDSNKYLLFAKNQIHSQFKDVIKTRINSQLKAFVKNEKNKQNFETNYNIVQEKYSELLNTI